jgi:hypothetical protein
MRRRALFAPVRLAATQAEIRAGGVRGRPALHRRRRAGGACGDTEASSSERRHACGARARFVRRRAWRLRGPLKRAAFVRRQISRSVHAPMVKCARRGISRALAGACRLHRRRRHGRRRVCVASPVRGQGLVERSSAQSRGRRRYGVEVHARRNCDRRGEIAFMARTNRRADTSAPRAWQESGRQGQMTNVCRIFNDNHGVELVERTGRNPCACLGSRA